MSVPPDPPEWLHGPHARAAWCNAFRLCAERCLWEPKYEIMLGVVAQSAATYVRFVHETAELDQVSDELAAALGRQRTITRELMVSFLLIEADAVDSGELRPDGLDREIAALCDVPPAS